MRKLSRQYLSKTFVVVILITLLFSPTSTLAAPNFGVDDIKNPGFETGDTTNWTVNLTQNQMDASAAWAEKPDGWDSCTVFFGTKDTTPLVDDGIGGMTTTANVQGSVVHSGDYALRMYISGLSTTIRKGHGDN